jgi:hypothetical protein
VGKWEEDAHRLHFDDSPIQALAALYGSIGIGFCVVIVLVLWCLQWAESSGTSKKKAREACCA